MKHDVIDTRVAATLRGGTTKACIAAQSSRSAHAAQAGDDNAGDDQQGDEDAAPVQSNDGECRGSYQRGECAEPAHQAMGVFLAGLSVFSGH